jgi:cob(I)alamin adenosyltransferase
MKIYTKTGDAGETALFDGTRVSKADVRVEAYGAVDELNALLGLARAQKLDADLDEMLQAIQRDLFSLGARLADPRHQIAERVKKAALRPDAVSSLERWIDAIEATLSPLRRFILAGGTPAAALLHLARAVSRRAERRIVILGEVDADVLVYINRLSDLLFVMARAVNARAHVSEVEW